MRKLSYIIGIVFVFATPIAALAAPCEQQAEGMSESQRIIETNQSEPEPVTPVKKDDDPPSLPEETTVDEVPHSEY